MSSWSRRPSGGGTEAPWPGSSAAAGRRAWWWSPTSTPATTRSPGRFPPCRPTIGCSGRVPNASSSAPPCWRRARSPPGRSERPSRSDVGKNGRAAIAPGSRGLELGGDPEQRRLVAKTRRELNADRQTRGVPVQRNAHRRLAGHVGERRKGDERKNPAHRRLDQTRDSQQNPEVQPGEQLLSEGLQPVRLQCAYR